MGRLPGCYYIQVSVIINISSKNSTSATQVCIYGFFGPIGVREIILIPDNIILSIRGC